MKKLLVTLALLLITQTAFAFAFDHSHAAWDALLKQQVVLISNGNASQVDYAGFIRRDGPIPQVASRDRRPMSFGGRAGIRAVLYMATASASRCNPVIKAFYQRLRKAGVPRRIRSIALCYTAQ